MPLHLGMDHPFFPPPDEVRDRTRAEMYSVPGQCANMISLIMMETMKLLEINGRDRQAYELMQPILLEFLESASIVISRESCRSEYPEYQKNGKLKPGVSEDEIYFIGDVERPGKSSFPRYEYSDF